MGSPPRSMFIAAIAVASAGTSCEGSPKHASQTESVEQSPARRSLLASRAFIPPLNEVGTSQNQAALADPEAARERDAEFWGVDVDDPFVASVAISPLFPPLSVHSFPWELRVWLRREKTFSVMVRVWGSGPRADVLYGEAFVWDHVDHTLGEQRSSDWIRRCAPCRETVLRGSIEVCTLAQDLSWKRIAAPLVQMETFPEGGLGRVEHFAPTLSVEVATPSLEQRFHYWEWEEGAGGSAYSAFADAATHAVDEACAEK